MYYSTFADLETHEYIIILNTQMWTHTKQYDNLHGN